jgi:hypothetical protein
MVQVAFVRHRVDSALLDLRVEHFLHGRIGITRA